MATKSSAVMGSLNIPNVPPVAPAWPSADVVAQQSVSVTVLKPARGGVAAMASWDSRTLRVERKTFWGVLGKCFGPNLSV